MRIIIPKQKADQSNIGNKRATFFRQNRTQKIARLLAARFEILTGLGLVSAAGRAGVTLETLCGSATEVLHLTILGDGRSG